MTIQPSGNRYSKLLRRMLRCSKSAVAARSSTRSSACVLTGHSRTEADGGPLAVLRFRMATVMARASFGGFRISTGVSLSNLIPVELAGFIRSSCQPSDSAQYASLFHRGRHDTGKQRCTPFGPQELSTPNTSGPSSMGCARQNRDGNWWRVYKRVRGRHEENAPLLHPGFPVHRSGCCGLGGTVAVLSEFALTECRRPPSATSAPNSASTQRALRPPPTVGKNAVSSPMAGRNAQT